MTKILHIDTLELHIDASTLVQHGDDGPIDVEGIGAHAGLYTYHDDKGAPFVELVPRATLHDPDSLATVPGTDVTIRHPAGLVTADNWRDVSHGVWLAAWPKGDDLGVKLRVKSPEGIAMIKDAADRGVPVELSPGYLVDVVPSPGHSEFGRHDAVQQGRVYNHIALLGPGEARGGPQMRLQLDGPVCAPANCRIQVGQVRHDARGHQMKKSTVKHGGQTVELDGARFGWLRSMSLDAQAVKADQIETATVTVAIEGEEPIELTLPKAMVEMMLEGIGAGAAAPVAEPAGMEAEEAVMAEDAGDEPKADAVLTVAQVDALIARRLRQHTVVQRRVDGRDAEVQRHARALKIDATDGRHWAQVALDAIAKASPEQADAARKLAADAKAGNAVSEGRLLERLATLAAASTPNDAAGTMAPGTKINHQRPKRDAREPWNSGKPNKEQN